MESGYEINGRFFPAITSFTLGDPILIRELTGLDLPEFVNEQEQLMRSLEDTDGDQAQVDPAVLIGLIGVAVWHENQSWSRSKVVRWVQSVPIDSVKFIGDEIEDEDSPPVEAPADSPTGGTPTVSDSSAGETANPNGSGDPTSLTGAELASAT